jgi:hypothetical protein
MPFYGGGGAGYFHIFQPKNRISTHTKDFCERNCPNLLDFQKLKIKITGFLQQVPVDS